MAGSPYERVLAAELLVVMTTQTFDALSGIQADASTGKVQGRALPSPSRFTATVIVYLMLAAVAMFGEKSGKLAAQFGGVAALAIVMTPGKGGQRPPVMGMLDWFNTMMTGGSVQAATDSGTTPSTTPAGVAPANTFPNTPGSTPIVTPFPGNAFPPAA